MPRPSGWWASCSRADRVRALCAPGFPAGAGGAASGQSAGADSATEAIGLALAHHGLVVWGDDAEECHARLVEVTGRMDELSGDQPTRTRGRSAGRSDRPAPPPDERRRLAELVLPVIRGASASRSG